MANKSIDITMKIRELEKAVKALKANRNSLLKELETVKSRARAKQTIA